MRIAYLSGVVVLALSSLAIAGGPPGAPQVGVTESIEQVAAGTADEMATLMEADSEFAASGSAELARLMANMIRDPGAGAATQSSSESVIPISSR